MKFESAHRRTSPGPNGKPDPKGKFWGYGSIATFNRQTHRPHENLREIARNMSAPGTELRRAYMQDARSGH